MDKGKALAKILMEIKDENAGKILSQMEFLNELMTNGLADLLVNPVIPNQKKKDIFAKITRDIQLNKQIREMIDYLIKEELIDNFPQILGCYEKMLLKQSKMVRVDIVSCELLPEEKLLMIKKTLQEKLNKEPLITNVVDESVLGGIKIKIGDQLYDNTLSKRVSELYGHLTM